MTFAITEPHPSVPRTRYMPTGRGGAGNMSTIKNLPTTTLINPPASATALRAPPSQFMTGRGGAGNLASRTTERGIFSFDEELAREKRQEERSAPVYYVGRGGAGNYSYSRGKTWAWEERTPSRSNRGGSVHSDESRSTADSNASDRSHSSVSARVGSAWARLMSRPS